MNFENGRVLEKVLGVVQIVIALFYVDRNDPNQVIVSVLLFLGGVLMLMFGSEKPFLRKAHTVLVRIVLLAGIAFIFKLLFFG
jgi:hypothetical protein